MPISGAGKLLHGPTPQLLVRLWVNAVVANGGSVSAGRITLFETYVSELLAYGAWWALDDFWMLVAENEAQALTSFKQLRLAVATNAPTFTIDRGYAFDGATNYINTGFIPSTMAGAMNGSNIRGSVYERTNVNANTGAFGSTSQGQLYIRPRNGSNGVTARNCSNATAYPDAITDSRGFTVTAKVANSTAVRMWKNGVRGTDGTAGGVSTVLPATALFIGGVNNAGALNTPRASTIGYVSVGAPTASDSVELAVYKALQTFMTAVGANV